MRTRGTDGAWGLGLTGIIVGRVMDAGVPVTTTRSPFAEADGVPPHVLEDIALVASRARRAVLDLATSTYVVVMTAVTAMAVASPETPIVSAIATILVGAALTAIVAYALMRSSLRRLAGLSSLGSDLRERFDIARLDAIRDPLTGLGNHRAFQEELDRAAATADRQHQSTTLLLIDVDHLKRINDTEGHAAGDEVLRAVARVITMNSRRADRAFRIGGDEFAILSVGAHVDDALTLGRRVLATALDIGSSPSRRAISLTIGISAIPVPSADRHLLFRHADAALYWGKRHGRTDVQVYDPRLHGIADDERPSDELALAVDHVVAERLLTPAYQPIFALADGRCIGFEGLVRPTEEARFRNATALFVAAETVSRTVELDIAAVRELAAGAGALGPDGYLAVNLSPRTLEAVAFNPHEILGIVGRAGIEPHRLVVELTEREAVEDMDRLVRNLAVLRRTGARIAADDVGAGNAGLHLLSRIDFDVIKIDLSLVQSGAVLAPSRAVLRALIEMAQRRGATTVAEGIETSIQLEIVRELGIHAGQGFRLGPPADQPLADQVDLERLLPTESRDGLTGSAFAA